MSTVSNDDAMRTCRERMQSMPVVDTTTPEAFTADVRRMLAEQAPSLEVVHTLGQEWFRERDYLRARACFAIAADDTRAIGAIANQVRCDIRLGEMDVAHRGASALVQEHPGHAMAWQVLGEVLAAQRQYAEAADALREAVERSAPQAPLLQALGEMLEGAGAFEAARDAYVRALALDEGNVKLMAALLYLKRRLFDWRSLVELSARMQRALVHSEVSVPPFDFIAEGASAAQQLAVARRLAELSAKAATQDPLPPLHGWPVRGDRLRVGFVSHGFGAHPTTVLTSALFERWRESALEVHLFATSRDTGAPARQRLAQAAHAFHDMSALGSRDLALRVRELGIEILVDLNGYCGAYRPKEFAYRPAPIQVNWQGYPGTTGASYMDYVIADRFVLPPSLGAYHSERVVYLPRCYQSNDPTRVVGEPPSRAACGLPKQGVVYACFNTTYKLNPHSVERMFAVLHGVPGSVLWLLQPAGQGVERLRALAKTRGIDPQRVVFMQKLPHLEYLARYRHADLFLDTEQFNAHTTASDAIWAGCPVLTRPGDTFATRVAGSINHHLGMPELNAANDRDFVALAVRIGRDAHYRQRLRERLTAQKERSGQFDIGAFAHDMQALLLRMAEHGRRGGAPADFNG